MLPHAWLETWSNRVCPCFAATLSKGAMISLPSNFPLLTYKLTSSIADAPALRIRCRSIHANEEGIKVLQAIYLMAFLSASTSDFTATSLHLYLGCNPITMSRKKNRYRKYTLSPWTWRSIGSMYWSNTSIDLLISCMVSLVLLVVFNLTSLQCPLFLQWTEFQQWPIQAITRETIHDSVFQDLPSWCWKQQPSVRFT